MKAYLFVSEHRNPLDSSIHGAPKYHVTYGVDQESAKRLEDFRPIFEMELLEQLCYFLEQRVLGKPITPKGKRRTAITGIVNAVDRNYGLKDGAYPRPLNKNEIEQLSRIVRNSLARD